MRIEFPIHALGANFVFALGVDRYQKDYFYNFLGFIFWRLGVGVDIDAYRYPSRRGGVVSLGMAILTHTIYLNIEATR